METTLKQRVYEYLKREYKAALLDMEVAAVDTPEYIDAQRRAARTSNTCAAVIGFQEADKLREDNIEAVNRIIERQEAARR